MEKKKPYAASQFRWKHRIIFDFFLEMAGLTGKRQFLPRLIRSNGGEDILAEIAPLSGIHSPSRGVVSQKCICQEDVKAS